MALPVNIRNGLDILWDRIQASLRQDKQENIRVTVAGNEYKIKIFKAPHSEITDSAEYVIKIYKK